MKRPKDILSGTGFNKTTNTMNRYVEQLLDIMLAARDNREPPRELVLPEEMEFMRDVIELERSMEEDQRTMEDILGVPQHYFPPEDRLTDAHVERLKIGILELWRAFNYEADFREGEFDERQQYTKLVEKWKEHVPYFRGSNGTWHLEMYDYDDL